MMWPLDEFPNVRKQWRSNENGFSISGGAHALRVMPMNFSVLNSGERRGENRGRGGDGFHQSDIRISNANRSGLNL